MSTLKVKKDKPFGWPIRSTKTHSQTGKNGYNMKSNIHKEIQLHEFNIYIYTTQE